MGRRQRGRHGRSRPHATGGRGAGHHAGLTLRTLLLVVGAYLVVTVVVTAIALRIVVTLPPDHLVNDTSSPPRGLGAVAARVGRNLLGLLVIVVGIGLSLPGVPGQGLLTIAVGLLLVDFPGRRRVERALLSRPSVLSALDRVRARFGRPPLQPPRSP